MEDFSQEEMRNWAAFMAERRRHRGRRGKGVLRDNTKSGVTGPKV